MSRQHPSPLAHGPDADCDTCRPCPSCAGGTARIPTRYRVVLHPLPGDGCEARARCTDCDGRAVVCLNLLPDLERP